MGRRSARLSVGVGALLFIASCNGETDPMVAGRDAGTPAAVLPERIGHVTRALDAAMFDCPDRAWPGVSAAYRASQVLLVSLSSGTAYLWNDRSGRAAGERGSVSIMPVEGLGPEWRSSFHVGLLNGTPTLGLSLDQTERTDQAYRAMGVERWQESAIALALHEGFHFLSGQRGWSPGGGTRSIPYPEAWEPRYLRAALATALLAEVRDHQGPALPAAAFWQDRLGREQRPALDAIRATDVDEGAAEYATAVMSAVVDEGCAADEATLRRAVVAHLDEFVRVRSFSGGSEPYSLGVLAGLSLRAAGPDQWQRLVQSGVPLVEILLAGVAPEPHADDRELQAASRAAVETRNASVGAEVEPLLARMKSASQLRLPVPTGWTVGSFMASAFVTLIDHPGQPEVLLRYGATHEVPGGGPTITVHQSVIASLSNPCPTPAPARIVTFPADQLAAGARPGTHDLDSAEVTFKGLEATVVKDTDGLDWLCPRLP